MVYKTKNRTWYDFEHDYKARYGIYLDHDWLRLIELHGSEAAEKIIHGKVTVMNIELLRQMEAEKLAHEWQKIPASETVPFD